MADTIASVILLLAYHYIIIIILLILEINVMNVGAFQQLETGNQFIPPK